MHHRLACASASLIPLIALSAFGCGSSDDSHASESTSGAGGGSGSPTASASSGAGGRGTGGGGGAGGGGPFTIAPHPPVPQVVNLGGPVLKTPKVIAITYNDDVNQADTDKFTTQIAASTYWTMTTSEYGVGPLTVGAPIHISTASPKKTSEGVVLNTLKANLTGANPAWGAPDPDAIYSFIFPEGSILTSAGSDCCNDYYGFHDEVKVGGTKIAYAIVCTCNGVDNLTAQQSMTVTLSHELVEAATDPFPNTTPAYAQTGDADAGWSVITQGEVGDMCEFDGDQYLKPQDMDYMVQRTWSNIAAAADKDPCLPLATPPDVYFNSAPVVSDLVPVPFYGSTLMGKGVKIAVGQSRTIDVNLFSDAPTAGPWTLKVFDYNEVYFGKANLQFSLDKTTGSNGDVRKLTIKVLAQDPGLLAEPFYIESTLGNASNLWMGIVGQ